MFFYGYALPDRMPFELMKWLFVTGGPLVSQPKARIQFFSCNLINFVAIDSKIFYFPTSTGNLCSSWQFWSVLWAQPCAKQYKLWILQANKAIRVRLSARIETHCTRPLLLIDNKLPIQCARCATSSGKMYTNHSIYNWGKISRFIEWLRRRQLLLLQQQFVCDTMANSNIQCSR